MRNPPELAGFEVLKRLVRLHSPRRRMAGARLVARELAPEDRRGVYAVLTTAGKERLRAAAGSHLDGINRLFGAHLEPDEIAGLPLRVGQGLQAACGERS